MDGHLRLLLYSGDTWRLVQALSIRRQCRRRPVAGTDYRYINVVHKKQGTMTHALVQGWGKGGILSGTATEQGDHDIWGNVHIHASM